MEANLKIKRSDCVYGRCCSPRSRGLEKVSRHRRSSGSRSGVPSLQGEDGSYRNIFHDLARVIDTVLKNVKLKKVLFAPFQAPEVLGYLKKKFIGGGESKD